MALKDMLRSAIMEQFAKVQRDQHAVLITDPRSDRLLEEARVTLEELQALGVFEREALAGRRIPRPSWNAIYFLSPTAPGVRRIIEDLPAHAPLYRAAYVFVTGAVHDYLFAEFEASGTGALVKEFMELEIDFTPFESRAFHFDIEDATHQIYGVASDDEVDDMLAVVARRFRAVMAVLNQDPLIRYHDPDGDGSSLSARLAGRIAGEMTRLREFDQTFPRPTPYDADGPATLIVVDRAVDVIAPLLHSLSYECIARDLFEVTNEIVDGHRVEVESPNGTKLAVLEGSEEIYASIRHLFFIDAFDAVRTRVREFVERTRLAGNLRGAAGVEVLRAAVFNLPESLKKKERLEALVSLNTWINKAVMVERSLNELCELEQILCVGETADGQPAKDEEDIKSFFEEIMGKDTVQIEDKIRLFLLYIITLDCTTEEEREAVAERAGIDREDLAAIEGLRFFGIVPGKRRSLLEPDSPFTRQARKQAAAAAGGKPRKDGFAILKSLGLGMFIPDDLPASGRSPRTANPDQAAMEQILLEDYVPSSEYDAFDRFRPAVAFLLQDFLRGRLSHQSGAPFPYIENSAQRKRAAASHSAVRSRGDPRRGRGLVHNLPETAASVGQFRWGRGRPTQERLGDYRINGPPIILFVLGGLTYAEIRAAYLIADKYRREVYI
ncbi:Syntaxin-binding protein 2, partial [Cladochytrium tenue]